MQGPGPFLDESSFDGKNKAFPWGGKDAPERYNSGADFSQSGEGGSIDGFNFWSPVDAMTGDRLYQKGMEPQFVVSKLHEWKGSRYDPKVVDAMTRVYSRVITQPATQPVGQTPPQTPPQPGPGA